MTSTAKSLKKNTKKISRENPRPVVLVAGATAADKSTLINLILQRAVAEVGAGRPITQQIDKFENDSIIVYDSKGYETGDKAQREFFDEITTFIVEKQQNYATAINLIWYCISIPSARVTDADIKLILEFKRLGIPTALVLTQADAADEEQSRKMAEAVATDVPGIMIFESSNDPSVAKTLPRGLDALFQWSLDNIDVTKRQALAWSANRDLQSKLEKGRSIITRYVVAAGAAAAAPIPGSDAPLILTAQTGMIAHLSRIWGIGSLKEFLIKAGTLDIIMTQLGKFAAAHLAELVPGNIAKSAAGIGTIVGIAINAGVASTLTYGLGNAINETFYRICEAELKGEPINLGSFFDLKVLEKLMKMFSNQYKEISKKK